jgi:hypothetical protein
MAATATTNPTEEVTMSQSITFTHASYAEAQAALAANQRSGDGARVTWDAGDGWTGAGYYCSRRRRIITTAEKDGFVLH